MSRNKHFKCCNKATRFSLTLFGSKSSSLSSSSSSLSSSSLAAAAAAGLALPVELASSLELSGELPSSSSRRASAAAVRKGDTCVFEFTIMRRYWLSRGGTCREHRRVDSSQGASTSDMMLNDKQVEAMHMPDTGITERFTSKSELAGRSNFVSHPTTLASIRQPRWVPQQDEYHQWMSYTPRPSRTLESTHY